MITISIIALCVIGAIYCLFRKVGGCGYEVTHRPKKKEEGNVVKVDDFLLKERVNFLEQDLCDTCRWVGECSRYSGRAANLRTISCKGHAPEEEGLP